MAQCNTNSCDKPPIKPGRKYDSFSPELWNRIGLVEKNAVLAIEAVGPDWKSRSEDTNPVKTRSVRRFGESLRELFRESKCRTVQFRKCSGKPGQVGIKISGSSGEHLFIVTTEDGLDALWSDEKTETTGREVRTEESEYPDMIDKTVRAASTGERNDVFVKHRVLYRYDSPAVVRSVNRVSESCGEAKFLELPLKRFRCFDNFSQLFDHVIGKSTGAYVMFERNVMSKNTFLMAVVTPVTGRKPRWFRIGTDNDASTLWGPNVKWYQD